MTTHRSATLSTDDRSTTGPIVSGTPSPPRVHAASVARAGTGWQVARALGPVLAVIAAAVLATGAERARGPGLVLFLIGLGMSTLDRGSSPRR